MRFTVRHRAGEHERYAPSAWDSSVGARVAVEGGGDGRVVAAEVVEDGRAVELTIEAEIPRFDHGRLSIDTEDSQPKGDHS